MSNILPQLSSVLNNNFINHFIPNSNYLLFWESNYANSSLQFIQNYFISLLESLDEDFFNSYQRNKSLDRL